jgi:hypothetical protein
MTRSLSTVAVLFFIGLFQAQVQAFAPPRPASFSSATRIAAARPARAAALVLRMSEGDEEKPKVSADGTFYDDEVSLSYLIELCFQFLDCIHSECCCF